VTQSTEVKQEITRNFLGAGRYVKGQLQVEVAGMVKINIVEKEQAKG
jgi:hypothetical protein